MIRTESRRLRLLTLLLALAVTGAACGGDDDEAAGGTEQGATQTTARAVPTGPDTPAAQLRTTFEGLLGEHAALSAAATGAAAAGRGDDSAAATTALEGNTDALTAAVTAVFDEEVGAGFEERWSRLADAVVAYAGPDGQQAAATLDSLPGDLGTFFASVLPELSAEDASGLFQTHVANLRTIADAQAGGDHTAAYTGLRRAVAHAGEMSETLVSAVSAEFPDKVSGAPDSDASELQAALTGELREHVHLVVAATGAALGGRQDEFMAAAAAVEANSDALTATVGGVFGADAERAFEPMWKRHVGFLVDYTTGVAGRDNAKRDQATSDLLAWTGDFGSFFSRASPELTEAVVADLGRTHVLTVKDVIDAQGNGDLARAYTNERTAGDHTRAIATQLAAAIATQFPDRY